MTTTFPTSLQDLDATRGTTGQSLSSPNHITHHTTEDDTLEALQAKVGVDNSAVTTSLDYIAKNASSNGGGHVQTIATGGTGQITKAAAMDALSPLTTKGDIIGYSTTNTRLAVGSNGSFLVADSTQTTGLKWLAAVVTYKNGIATRAANSASGSQTIAHGLGLTPKRVTFTAVTSQNSDTESSISNGSWDSGGQNVVWLYTSTTTNVGNSAGSVILVYTDPAGNYQEANMTADATNITLTWTKNGAGSPSGTINILWTAEG